MQKEISYTFPSGVTKSVTLSSFAGKVLDTDQRSDTYVSGRGSSTVYQGSGGGSSYVSSKVVVQRDIWLVDKNGKELHIRTNKDIPVRTDQSVCVISATRKNNSGNNWTEHCYLYNLNTDTFYFVDEDDFFLISHHDMKEQITKLFVNLAKFFAVFFLLFGLHEALMFLFHEREGVLIQFLDRDISGGAAMLTGVYAFYKLIIKGYTDYELRAKGQIEGKKTAWEMVHDSTMELIEDAKSEFKASAPA